MNELITQPGFCEAMRIVGTLHLKKKVLAGSITSAAGPNPEREVTEKEHVGSGHAVEPNAAERATATSTTESDAAHRAVC